jgi:hypothetical protein
LAAFEGEAVSHFIRRAWSARGQELVIEFPAGTFCGAGDGIPSGKTPRHCMPRLESPASSSQRHVRYGCHGLLRGCVLRRPPRRCTARLQLSKSIHVRHPLEDHDPS